MQFSHTLRPLRAPGLLALLAAGLLLLSPLEEALADGSPNAFNPYSSSRLPSSKGPKGQGGEILKALGGRSRSLADEAAHRPHWKDEAYPVLRGELSSQHEVLVLLDFADPASRPLWRAAAEATAKAAPGKARLVLFGQSQELYATDLVGLAAWAARERRGQAVDYVTWALARWDEVKAAQKRAGRLRPFRTEYDGVAGPKDYPMAFAAMARFKPAVPEAQQSPLARYAYEAGNINLFQTTEVRAYYGVDRLPALVVDGKVYREMSAERLESLLR